MTRYLFVDFENVQEVDLAALPRDVHVRFILGSKQKTLPTKLAVQSQPLGERVKHVLITDMAPNAVDFCLAFYVGEVLAHEPQAECVILSRDKKGFDPLVKHLVGDRGFAVKRVNTQKEAFPAAKPAARVRAAPKVTEPFDKLLKLLAKEKDLPKKRKGLEGKIKSWFQKASDAERGALLQRLFADAFVKEAGGAMEYSLRR